MGVPSSTVRLTVHSRSCDFCTASGSSARALSPCSPSGNLIRKVTTMSVRWLPASSRTLFASTAISNMSGSARRDVRTSTSAAVQPPIPAGYGDPAADQALAVDVAAGRRAPANRMHDYLAARTSFFDRAVTGALDRGVAQVVVGAAGYDGRAFRYAKPGVRWFEVDHPATQRDKLERLERLRPPPPPPAVCPAPLPPGPPGGPPPPARRPPAKARPVSPPRE